MYICYKKPAEYNYNGWEKQALPMGNGKIGVKVFGGVQCELIQFNEKTLWSGGANLSGFNHGVSNPDHGKALKEVRELIAGGGKYSEVCSKMRSLEGNEDTFGSYQTFGNIYISFNEPVPCSDNTYIRDLDFETGSCMVVCQKGVRGQNRHYFVSYPDNVFVGKIESTGEDMLDFTLSVQSEQNGKTVYSEDCAFLKGTVNGNISDGNQSSKYANDMEYCCVIKVIPDDGEVSSDESGITVKNCFSATVIMSCATNYANVYPVYRRETDLLSEVKETVDKASQMSFKQLFKRHIDDYKTLMSRVKLNIGQSDANVTTDHILKAYKKNQYRREAESALFDYGRYLLISSSRDGSLPANLQGIWNSINNPAWNCDYHLNINLQMNYFHAMNTNLAETVLPLLDFADSLRKPGRYVANVTAGIGENKADGTPDTDKPTGWVAHTQVSPMGMVNPGSDFHWGWAPTNSAFLMHSTFEYYEFTKDIEILREKIYPALEESALFFSKYLIYDKNSDRYVCSPSLSPEHGPVTAGCTYDQTLVYDLFANTVTAANDLVSNGMGECVNKELIEKIKELIPMLKPISISKKGYIKEWYDQDSYSRLSYKKLNIQKHHRHTSHLLGVYPMNVIAAPKELEAAKKSLSERGISGPGWSQVLKIAEYARMGEGEKCYELIEELIKTNVYDNLWTSHPPFQIDANFGYTAAVTEMLMQSHRGYIDILPALPDEWSSGSVEGIVARGNFEVSFEWSNKKLKKGTVKSNIGGMCRIRHKDKYIGVSDENGNDIEIKFENGIVEFSTEKGKIYNIY